METNYASLPSKSSYLDSAKNILGESFREISETVQSVTSRPLLTCEILKTMANINVKDDAYSKAFTVFNDLFIYVPCQFAVQLYSKLCLNAYYRFSHHEMVSKEDIRIQHVAIARIAKVLMAMSRYVYTPQLAGDVLLYWTGCYIAGMACVYIARKADPFFRKHIYPLADYKLIQWPFKIAVELSRIEATALVIIFGQYFIMGPTFLNDNFKATIFAPFSEEFFFRGFLLGGSYQLYKKLIQVREKSEEPNVSRMEKMYLIFANAIVFGLCHASNKHLTFQNKLVQCAWTVFGGISYGLLCDKSETLSFSIVVHSINNTIASTSNNPFNIWVQVIALKLVCLEAGTGTISSGISYCVSKVKQAVCIS